MTDIIIRIVTGWMVEVEEHNLVVESNMDWIIDVDQGMDKAIRTTLGEEISEVMQECNHNQNFRWQNKRSI